MGGGVFLAAAGSVAAVLPVIVLGGTMLWAARHLVAGTPDSPDSVDHARRALWFRWANILQYAGIGLVVVEANIAARPDLIPLGISAVVALHFLPLAHVFRNPLHYATAAVMLGSDAFAFARAPHQSAEWVCLGSGAALWGNAAVQLVLGYRLPLTRGGIAAGA